LRSTIPTWSSPIGVIRTRGDPGVKSGKGLFVRELEKALLAGEIDLVVHSAKDLPVGLPPGLILAAIPARSDPRDALISRDGYRLDELPLRVRVGTGSPSRALAAPACAGIPLTHRQFSSAVAIVTGHEASDKTGPAVDWGELGRTVDTLVILMGVGNLPRQQVLTSALAEVVDKAQGFEPPAVIVIGEVVQLRKGSGWFERKPLFGRRILVAGEAARLASLTTLLAEKGAQVMEQPVIRVVPNEDTAPLDQAIKELGGYTWLVFTSDKGVRFFWAWP